MPRRRGPEAGLAANKARESQWRYLLRNPAFRNDINELLDTYDLLQKALLEQRAVRPLTVPQVEVRPTQPGSSGGVRERLGLPPVSDVERRRAELQSKARRLEEKLTALTTPLGFAPVSEIRRRRFNNMFGAGESLPKLTTDTVGKYELLGAWGSPVSVIEDQDGEAYLTADELGDPHTLYLAIELAYPQDVLLSLIEQTLRQVIGERSKLIKRDSRKRLRSDTADMGRAVYDQVVSGATFQKIASKLKRPVSSVKSAYLAACRNIHGSHPPRPKRHMPLEGFDPAANHFQTCKDCKDAQRPEDFCGPNRAYTNQDYVSQRERPVGEEPRKHRGNRLE
jgi:hypothetical protein